MKMVMKMKSINLVKTKKSKLIMRNQETPRSGRNFISPLNQSHIKVAIEAKSLIKMLKLLMLSIIQSMWLR